MKGLLTYLLCLLDLKAVNEITYLTSKQSMKGLLTWPQSGQWRVYFTLLTLLTVKAVSKELVLSISLAWEIEVG